MEIPQFDRNSQGTVVLAVATGLMAIGTVMVLSSEARLDESLLELSPRVMPALRQAAYALMGFGLMVLMRLVPYRAFGWRRGQEFQPALVLVLVAAALLLLVYVPEVGMVRNGARRWIRLGAVAFQPSEVAKLALVVFTAAWFSASGRDARRFVSGLLPVVGVMVVLIGLVGLEDFGTAALLAMVGGAMLVAAGCRGWHLAVLGLPGAVLLAALLVGKEYRMVRLMAFRDVWADPQGTTYHPLQSLCTIASGGW